MTTIENYCNDLWPLIYDRYNQGRHQEELAFYSAALAACTGPVLEVACGTGMILLPMLAQGLDIYGFDLSAQMLARLFAKADFADQDELRRRVSRQDMVSFNLEHNFDAIFIPARSFLHLVTQDDQIACLRNIHHHLLPGGRLLLNFFTPNLRLIQERTDPDAAFIQHGTYPHPDGGPEIVILTRQVNDPAEQVQHITWRFEMGNEVFDSPMQVRWIYKQEFQLLTHIAGFRVAALYSGFDRTPYTTSEGEMVWVLEKA